MWLMTISEFDLHLILHLNILLGDFMEYDKTLSLHLEVLAGNKVMVPGCEPTSALTSVKLSSWLQELGCGSALVDVQEALEAIPGSYLKFGTNFNRGNFRQRWLVLPAKGLGCPCDEVVDYYAILRSLARPPSEVTESYAACDVIGMGYCPSPDFDSIPESEPDPYMPEHTFPGQAGVLPPIPPWGLTR